MFSDMVKPRVKRGAPSISVGKASRNPHLNAARRSIVTLMAPVLAQCQRDGLVLQNRNTPSHRLTPSQLEDEWRRGRYIWGPRWWRLMKAEEQ